jgi:hypothetical protein
MTAAPARMMARDAVDNAHHAGKPRCCDMGIECNPPGRQEAPKCLCTGDKIIDLVGDDLLGIARTDADLDPGGCINVDLQFGIASAQHIALEMRRDVDDERVGSGIHQSVDVAFLDRLGWLEIRR